MVSGQSCAQLKHSVLEVSELIVADDRHGHGFALHARLPDESGSAAEPRILRPTSPPPHVDHEPLLPQHQVLRCKRLVAAANDVGFRVWFVRAHFQRGGGDVPNLTDMHKMMALLTQSQVHYSRAID